MRVYAVYTEQVNAMRFLVPAKSAKAARRQVAKELKGYIPEIHSIENTHTEEQGNVPIRDGGKTHT